MSEDATGKPRKPLHERVAAALDAAGDATGTALIELVSERHHDDAELVDEVRALFGAKNPNVPLLNQPAAGAAAELAKQLHDRLLTSEMFTKGGTPRTSNVPQEVVRVPARVGAYEVIGVLGQGGMGVVYEAQQSSPRRRVAIKMLSTSAPSRSALARFRREVDVLGQLKHPGIAQVFEAATDQESGAAFFAMELVRGRTITEYANTKHLSTPARIELLARVCDAIQHAHQAGIIHRDIKPSNILVEELADGQTQPKVLDFGVSTMTQESQGLDATLSLDAGRIIGTLGYMSPEAFDPAGARADTRSDVYSLGVLLHELLTDELPIDIKGVSLTEAARRVREQEPRALGEVAQEADAAMRADLAVIVWKALEKEASLRYASASELAADLRRCLRHEPILARPPSVVYSLRRFVRRRRGVSLMVAGALACIAIAAVVAFVASLRAEEARKRENEQREIADRRREDAERGQYRVALSAAGSTRRIGNAGGARQALADAPEHLRGWEWRYLWRSINAGEVVELPEPVATVQAVPGTDLALSRTTGAGNKMFVWNHRTRKMVGMLALNDATVSAGDGVVVGVSQEDSSRRWIRAYSLRNAQLGGEIGDSLWEREVTADVHLQSVPSDPKQLHAGLVLIGEQQRWTVVDAATGRVLREENTSGNVRSVRLVQSVNLDDPTVVEYFVEASDSARRSQGQRWIESVVKGERRAMDALTPSRNLHWWVSNGQLMHITRDFDVAIASVEAPADTLFTSSLIADDNSMVALGDSRGSVQVFAVNPHSKGGLKLLDTLLVGDGSVINLAFLADAHEIAIVDQTGKMRIAGTQRPIDPWRVSTDEHGRPGPFSNDASRGTTVSWGSVEVFDSLIGVPIWQANFGREQPTAMAWSADDKTIWWCGGDSGGYEAYLLDAATGEVLKALGDPTGYSNTLPATNMVAEKAPWDSTVMSTVLVDDGHVALMLHQNASISRLDLRDFTWKELVPAVKDGFGRQLIGSPDGTQVVAVATKGDWTRIERHDVVVMRVSDLQPVARLTCDAATCGQWSGDGASLALGHANGRVSLWDARTWTMKWQKSTGMSDAIRSVAIARDGSRVVAGSLAPMLCVLTGRGDVAATIALPVPDPRPQVLTDDDALLATPFRSSLMRLDAGLGESGGWTQRAIDAWPKEVARPQSVQAARLLIQCVDSVIANLMEQMLTTRERVALVEKERASEPEVAALARAWLERTGPHLNWSNSDALRMIRADQGKPESMRRVVSVLSELIERRPNRESFRMNCATACSLVGDADAAIEHLRAANAIAEAKGTGDEPQRLLAMLNVLAGLPDCEMTRETVVRTERVIDAVQDQGQRTALLAEFEVVKVKLPPSNTP